MTAQEIIDEWNKKHPSGKYDLPEDVERLIHMVMKSGDGEQAAALARKIIENREQQKKEKIEKEVRWLKDSLDKIDYGDNVWGDDYSIRKVRSLTMMADKCAIDFIDHVLHSQTEPYHEVMKKYQEAIKLLCARWGFADNIPAMLNFVFSSDLCDDNFYKQDDSEYYSSLAHDKKLSDWEEDYDLEEHLGKAVAKWIEENEDAPYKELWDQSLWIERFDGDVLPMLVANSVFICFNPDAIDRLAAAEEVLKILFCFLNGATSMYSDVEVYKGKLRKRIKDIESSLQKT